MSVYTVHQPPPRDGAHESEPERFVFIRDGFYFWAFLLAPLWLAAHRLWLALVAYVVLSIGLELGVAMLTRSSGAAGASMLLLGVLVGLEAATLRRWTLARRKWREIGVVVADDLDGAERRFFDAWMRDDAPSPRPLGSAALAAPLSLVHSARPGSEVVGLFPEPGGSR